MGVPFAPVPLRGVPFDLARLRIAEQFRAAFNAQLLADCVPFWDKIPYGLRFLILVGLDSWAVFEIESGTPAPQGLSSHQLEWLLCRRPAALVFSVSGKVGSRAVCEIESCTPSHRLFPHQMGNACRLLCRPPRSP
jgi:hypothetical protein